MMTTILPTPLSARNSKHVFEMLDGLRGVAALSVVIMHVRPLFGQVGEYMLAYLAVDLFFSLSGFVLDHAYRARLSGGMLPIEFITRRLIRLYPLYLLGLLVGLSIAIFSYKVGKIDPTHLTIYAFSQAMIIPIPLDSEQYLFPLNSPCWSLFWEIVINFIYVSLYPYLSTKRIIYICALFFPAIVISIWAYHGLNGGVSASDIPIGFVRVTFSFFFGVLINRLMEVRQISYISGSKANLITICVSVVLFVTFMLHPHGITHAVLDFLLVTVLFPILILLGAQIRVKGLVQKICMWLGSSSYAIYVLHVPGRDIILTLMHVSSIQPSILLGSVFVIVLTAICLVLDRYYDLPMRRRLSLAFYGR